MARLISIILVILLASPAWAFPPLIAGKTASGGAATPTPELFYETFAGANSGTGCAGSFDATTWVCTVADSNTFNGDGTQGVYTTGTLTIASGGSDAKAKATWSASNTDWYASVDFYISGTWGASFQNINLFFVGASTEGNASSSYVRWDGAKIDLTFGHPSGESDSTNGANIDANTWHTLKFYKPNGDTHSSWKLNAGGPWTSTTGTAVDRDADNFVLGETAASTTTTIYYKNIKFCTTAAACGW